MTEACIPAEFVGYGQSNTRVLVTSETPVQLLNVPLPPTLGTRREGMATIHIAAAPLNPGARLPASANSKLVVNVKWQAGSGGGEVDIDGDHGMIFTLGAATSIVATAQLESATFGAPIVVGTTYSLEATVKWGAGGGPGPAQLTLPAMVIGEGGDTGAWLRVPRQARTLSVMCDNAAGYGVLVGMFSRDGAAAAVVETLTAPRDEPVPGGAAFWRVRGRVGDLITPVWKLWTG